MSSIQVTINGKRQTVGAETSIARLLDSLELNRQQVAVEVNARLVPRERHAECRLCDGDQIEVVTLVGGG